MEITKEVVSVSIWVAYLVAQEIFIFVGTRRTENFHVDTFGEDLIPSCFNIQWLVSLENVFNGIVSLIKIT